MQPYRDRGVDQPFARQAFGNADGSVEQNPHVCLSRSHGIENGVHPIVVLEARREPRLLTMHAGDAFVHYARVQSVGREHIHRNRLVAFLRHEPPMIDYGVELLDHLADRLHVVPACGSQRQRIALEQLKPKLPFQIGDMPAQARLRYVQPAGSKRVVQALSQDDEFTRMIEHAPLPTIEPAFLRLLHA